MSAWWVVDTEFNDGSDGRLACGYRRLWGHAEDDDLRQVPFRTEADAQETADRWNAAARPRNRGRYAVEEATHG